jgi:hypothetical protein
MRGHFKSAEFEEAQAAGGGVRGVEFIDAELGTVCVAGEVGQNVTENPVD